MTDPKNQIREYLKNLVNQVLYINSLTEQLKKIKEWESVDKLQALNIGAYFFSLVAYSFNRTILIELNKLFSDKEDKSIIDFLLKAKEHSGSIEPMNFNLETQKKEILSSKAYIEIITQQEEIIASKSEIIANIKTHRDKALAHSDSKYFAKPESIYEAFPLEQEKIDGLLSAAQEILRIQYVYLLETDMEIKVNSIHSVEPVLQYVRAYERILNDEKNAGANFLKYKWDGYKKE